MASRLLVTRCVDVHLLGATDATDATEEPVVFVRRLKVEDCELLLDND
jgi:hypothetical protein